MNALTLTALLIAATAPSADAGLARSVPDAGAASVPSKAPLPVAQRDAALSYLEWVLDARLTRAQREEGERAIEATWDESSGTGSTLIAEIAKAQADLGNHSPNDLVSLRASVE